MLLRTGVQSWGFSEVDALLSRLITRPRIDDSHQFVTCISSHPNFPAALQSSTWVSRSCASRRTDNEHHQFFQCGCSNRSAGRFRKATIQSGVSNGVSAFSGPWCSARTVLSHSEPCLIAVPLSRGRSIWQKRSEDEQRKNLRQECSSCMCSNPSAGRFLKATIQSGVSKGVSALSGPWCAARISRSSSEPCLIAVSLSRGRSIWQKRSKDEQRKNLHQECSSIMFENSRSSLTVSLRSRSALLRFRASATRNRYGIESRIEFHTVFHRDGKYICASIHGEGDAVDVEALEESGGVIDTEEEIATGAGTGSDVGELEQSVKPEFWVVSFYHFVGIEDPHLEVARHTSFFKGKDVRGRIYISHQGINAQLSGPRMEAIGYGQWVKEDSRFSNLLVQTVLSPKGHAFPRLRLRYKPSLVQVEGGTLHLPITDPVARAVHLSPHEWAERLNAAEILGNSCGSGSQELEPLEDGQSDSTGSPFSNIRRPVVLLDVRNGYEWDVGHFGGAQRPNVDCFKSTKFGLTENELVSSDPLTNVDKDAVDVMMYCTGGIRCDVFSTMLRQKGFTNLYTLEGGVSNYLKEEGPKKWAGNLFVFDSRLAVSPKAYHTKELTDTVEPVEHDTPKGLDCAILSTTPTFARCRLCGDPISEPRHRNCANLDCNLLFMSCEDCLSQHKGCCSQGCSSGPKLRPLLLSQQYGRWHNYRPSEPKCSMPDGYVSRRALKRRRRKERRKQLQEDATDEQRNMQVHESHVALTNIF